MADILIFGASGLLGQHLRSEALSRGLDVAGTYSTTPAPNLIALDLSDLTAVGGLLERIRPGLVLLAAAMTSVEACEAQSNLAEAVNAEAPFVVAQHCARLRAGLVYFSTDYVFNGASAPVDEETRPDPLNVYGRTKALGEDNVEARHPSPLILRTCANFGWNRLRGRDNSVTWILRKLRAHETIPVFEDQWVSPSYVRDVAHFAFDLVERGVSGRFHIATRDCLTRVDMGHAICDVFRLPRELVIPTKLDDAPLTARRPHRSCLAVSKVERTLNIRSRSFRECLTDMRDTE